MHNINTPNTVAAANASMRIESMIEDMYRSIIAHDIPLDVVIMLETAQHLLEPLWAKVARHSDGEVIEPGHLKDPDKTEPWTVEEILRREG